MDSHLDRLEKAHDKLDKECPFISVMEQRVVDSKVYVAGVGQKFRYEHLMDNRGYKLKVREVPRPLLEELVSGVEKQVEIKAADMKRFLEAALENEMPDIVLKSLKSGEMPESLRKSFVRMMDKRVEKVQKLLLKAPVPSGWKVEYETTVDSFGGWKIDISIQRSCGEGSDRRGRKRKDQDSSLEIDWGENDGTDEGRFKRAFLMYSAWNDIIDKVGKFASRLEKGDA